jgi:hypothetical protein
MGLNITVQSYDQSLDFGLMADARAMPDVRRLADAIGVAFEAFRDLPLHDDDAPGSAARPQPIATKATSRRRAPKTSAGS